MSTVTNPALIILPDLSNMNLITADFQRYTSEGQETKRDQMRARLSVLPPHLQRLESVLRTTDEDDNTHLFRLLAVSDEILTVAEQHDCDDVFPYTHISKSDPTKLKLYGTGQGGAWSSNHEQQVRL